MSRFITVGTDTFLGCDVCFRACHTRPEVTHHTRSSHLACEHDATPRDRAACRAARRRGEVYGGEGYGDDTDDELVQVIRVNGGKVHGADELGAPVCTGKPTKSGTADTAPVSDVDCTRCLATLDMAA